MSEEEKSQIDCSISCYATMNLSNDPITLIPQTENRFRIMDDYENRFSDETYSESSAIEQCRIMNILLYNCSEGPVCTYFPEEIKDSIIQAVEEHGGEMILEEGWWHSTLTQEK